VRPSVPRSTRHERAAVRRAKVVRAERQASRRAWAAAFGVVKAPARTGTRNRIPRPAWRALPCGRWVFTDPRRRRSPPAAFRRMHRERSARCAGRWHGSSLLRGQLGLVDSCSQVCAVRDKLCDGLRPAHAAYIGLQRSRGKPQSVDRLTKSEANTSDSALEAEGPGFEPGRPLTRPNGFQDRRIQPLCHPSKALRARSSQYQTARPEHTARLAKRGGTASSAGSKLAPHPQERWPSG
jgi:hypothetical protein